MSLDELAELLDAINEMIGEHVQAQLVLDFGGELGVADSKQLSGLASWRGEKPACGPAFLTIGDSGLPVGSHGCSDVQRVAGGVRWRDSVARYSIDVLVDTVESP